MKKLVVETAHETQFIDITGLVRDAVQNPETNASACLVFSPHTTAGITINEHADPAVSEDMIAALEELIPQDHAWHHREGNSPAHVKASLVGSSVFVGVDRGRLALGTWQGIFLCEFDGPRTREIWLTLLD